MSDFSKLPQDALAHAVKQGYVGIYFEQGVPILDRDLNLLQDLVSAQVRSLVGRYIGNGLTAGGQGFEIRPAPTPSGGTAPENTFLIAAGNPAPGRCLVGGIEVAIPSDVLYNKQTGVATLKTPTGSGSRSDTVYLDVSLVTVDFNGDDTLRNADDVGVQTSVRVKPAWTVRVAEGSDMPPPAAAGHAHYPLARLTRPAANPRIEASMITDVRQTRLNLDDVERRMREVERHRVLPILRAKPDEFEPKGTGAGGEVTIFGRNLDLPEVSVQFGAFDAKVTSVAPDQVKALVPEAATGEVPITVTTGGGTVMTVDRFKVRGGGPPPTFAEAPHEFDPKSGGKGTPVTLFGVNFNLEPVTVLFGTVKADEVTPSPNQLATKVPAGVTGKVEITVSTRAGEVTSESQFTAGSPPAFTFSPSRGGVNAEVTLTGTNLSTPPVTVDFGTVRAEPTRVRDTEIKVPVPAGASGAINIKVTTGAGAFSSAALFTVIGGSG
jgi:hypothetical protein